ncbi:MAG: BatD family protein, partial [Bacteroidota bacterium]|nr:BatD family protein [Bacteroidota bacterium]
ISGSGNIKLIDKLPLAFPTDIETYDPKINDNITVNENGVNGSRTFEYLLIPRNAGDFKIKPVSFSYFDVDKKTYVTLNTNEFELTVEKGSGTESAVVTGVSKEDIKYIGNDIRFIKKKTSIKDRGLYFYNSVLFYLLLILPAILFIIFVLTWQRQIKQNSNLALVKNRKATKIANKRLKTASHYLKENKRNEFFEEVSRALWGYLSDKFSIPGSELNKDNVHDKLFSKKVSEETISLIIELLTNCEFERFAPSGETGRMDKIYEDAIAIISKIENEIK